MKAKLELSTATISTHAPLTSITSSYDPLEEHISTIDPPSYEAGFLERMCDEIDNITRKSELERRRLYILNNAIKQARNVISVRSVKIRKAPNKKGNLRSLREALEIATSKLHNQQLVCGKYKRAIDNLRMEKIGLNQACEVLRVSLRKCPSPTQMHASNQEEDRLELVECRTQLNQLRKNKFHHRRQFVKSILQMGQDIQEQNDVAKKVHCRAASEGRSPKGYAMDDVPYSDVMMCRRIAKLAFLNCIQRRIIKQHQKNVEVFEQAFSTIKMSTGISGVDHIERILRKVEERNFSLISHINVLNRETQSFVIATRGNQFHECESVKIQLVQHEKSMAQLELSIQRTTKESSEKEEQVNALSAVAHKIVPMIQSIYRMMGTLVESREEIDLDFNDDIPRLLDVIFDTTKLYVDDIREKNAVAFKNLPFRLPELLPSYYDDEEEDDTLDTACTRTELKQRVEKAMALKKNSRREHLSRRGYSTVASPRNTGFASIRGKKSGCH